MLPGSPGLSFVALGGATVNVLAPSSGLITGPGGTITNTTLDGGNWSDHGYTTSPMPPGGTAILDDGTASQVVALDYPDGAGFVIVHTIPVEYYNDAGNFAIFHQNLFNFVRTLATTAKASYYSEQLNVGQSVSIITSTPADGPGAFANTLSPHVQLFDPSGSLVATGVVGPDGRNETITYTPLVSGTYEIEVTSKGGTSGEYFLAVASGLKLAVPANATEGDGTVMGSISIAAPLGNDLTLSIASSDTTRVTVPATVTISAGQTSVGPPAHHHRRRSAGRARDGDHNGHLGVHGERGDTHRSRLPYGGDDHQPAGDCPRDGRHDHRHGDLQPCRRGTSRSS